MTLSYGFWLVRWESLQPVAEQSNKEPQVLVMSVIKKTSQKTIGMKINVGGTDT